MELYTQLEYEKAKLTDLLPIKCDYCGETFYLTKRHIQKNSQKPSKFCSKNCQKKAATKTVEVTCKNCGKLFYKQYSQYLKTPNHFCSSSCAATYNNKHKSSGNRRSKLEEWLEKQLKELYPSINFLFNDKTAINSELDIFIPSLNLAFELNGIFHYEPIYGDRKLNLIKENDKNKFQLCQQNKISLCIIDTTSQKHFSVQSSEKFLKIIIKIIDENLKEL